MYMILYILKTTKLFYEALWSLEYMSLLISSLSV